MSKYECETCEVQGEGNECWIDPTHAIKRIGSIAIYHTMHSGLTHEQLTMDPHEQRD